MTGRNVATRRATQGFSASGQLRTIVSLASKESWSKDLLVGAGNVFGEFSNWHIADVYCWYRIDLLIALTLTC
jgi:hypothetical protein